MSNPESSIEKRFQKKLSRRRFMQTGVVAGLGLGGAVLLGEACTEQAAKTASTPAAGTTPISGAAPTVVTRPKPKGAAVFAITAIGGEPIDPHFERGGNEKPITRCMFEGLTICSLDGRIAPGLAESWTATADGWTFNLRKGVKFHSGNEFTADDVKFSWDRITKPEIQHPQGQQLAGLIDRVDILDKNKIFFHTPKPYAGLLNLILWFLIIDSKHFEKVGAAAFGSSSPSGTGPFKYVKHAKGQFYEFEAFEEHWATVPKVKTVTMRIIPEAATIFSALQTGEVDIAGISGIQYDEVKRGSTGIRAIILPNNSWNALTFPDLHHGTQSPFQDLRVRKAITCSINMKQLGDKLYYGLAKPGISPFMPNTFGYDPSLKPMEYNPDLAKQLLSEAGYPNGFETIITTTVGSTLAEALVGEWSRVGIMVKLNLQETNVYTGRMRSHAETTGMVPQGGTAYTDGLFVAVTFLIPGSPWGYNGDPKLTQMNDAMSVEMDEKKREKMIQEFSRFVYDNYYRPTIFWSDAAMAVGPKVVDYKPIQGGQTSQSFETIVMKE